MKKRSIFGIVFVAIAFVSVFAQGFAGEFALQINSETLSVVTPSGETVVALPQGTVGKPVLVEGSHFLLSFGRDVRNQLSAILSPVMDKNSPLIFTTLNKSVKTDGKAIVTIHYSSNLASAEIDPGFIGRVQVADLKRTGEVLPASLKTAESGGTPAVEKVTPVPVAAPTTKPSQKSEQDSSTKTAVAQEVVNPSSPQPASVQKSDSAVSNEATPPKDAFSVLKEEGISGLFDSKNMVAGLERSTKSNTKIGGIKLDKSKEMSTGTMKSLSPEVMAKAAQDKVGEVRLVQMEGNVTVDGKPAKENEIFSAQSVVKTGEKSSALVILGGLHLVTIHPRTEVSFSQSIQETKWSTLVDLKAGTVFADVNKRKGITQDFKIKSPQGTASATGSQALVGFIDGRMITIVFQSAWKGTDANGKPVYDIRPLTSSADSGIKIVSFGSIPAMPGAELQSIVTQIFSSISDNIVPDGSGKFKFVGDPVVSFLQGNSPTLPDGSTNPGATIEGKLRTLILTLTDTILESDEKDGGADLFVGFGGTSDPLARNDPNRPGGGTGSVQPGETTPGGR